MDKREIGIVDLDKDLEASAARILELKAGRDNGDIPMHDDYWKAVRKHKLAFGNKESK